MAARLDFYVFVIQKMRPASIERSREEEWINEMRKEGRAGQGGRDKSTDIYPPRILVISLT